MFRFQLEPYKSIVTKHTCPECGRAKVFTRYVDTEEEITFPDYVGRCNRENKCGYHFSPKQYFERNPHNSKHREYTPRQVAEIKPTNYISPVMVERSLDRKQDHHLYTFLSKQFGEKEANRLMEKYKVASSTYWQGSTLFWQIDTQGNARTGKIMLYDPTTGRRVKSPFNHVNWAHKILDTGEEFNLKQCFFGEHLLSANPNSQVAIVESEKSAIIASHYLPSMIWIATGGMNGCLRKENLKVLKSRKVVLFPDLGATEKWRAKLPLFKEMGIRVKLYDYLEQNATSEQQREGYDIADFLLEGKSPQSVLDSLIVKKPLLRNLIKALDLELEQNNTNN